MNVVDMILHWAKARPNQPAIIQPDMIITYKQFGDAINSIAARIWHSGLNQRQPVAVSIEHPTYQLMVCFALMRCGVTVAPVYHTLVPALREHGIIQLIHLPDSEPLPGGLNIQFDNRWLVPERSSSPGGIVSGSSSAAGSDLIFFSSGTTGRPKKIVHTNSALLERLKLSAVSGDAGFLRTLIVPGLNGSFGFFSAWSIFSAGHTACFAPLGEPSLHLVGTYAIEYIAASPRQALSLIELVEKGGGYQLGSLRAIRIGGSLVSREFIQRVRANLCPNVFMTYGSTEVGTVALASYDTIANTPGAVGFILPSAELEIVDESDNVLAPGVEGLVRCRTPIFLMNFIANNPGATVEGRELWFYPGDSGYITADGKLCISGRADDVINRGGEKLSAVDLEDVLRSCGGIDDAAVCGVWAGSGIEEIWAGITPRPDLDVDPFVRSLARDPALRGRLDTSIDRVFVVDRLPRTQAGKVQRGELRNTLLKMSAKSAQ